MHPELKAHPEYFRKEVVQIADNVFQAFGYAASNVYMIRGDDGLVIIDTSESTGAAENILAEFRKISDLPVRTIIYTHSHRDHVSGATVFAEGGQPEIFASTRFSDDSLIVASAHPRPTKAMQVRTKRQFGIGLSYPDEIIGIGVGPGDRPLKGLGMGSVPPTRRIGDGGERISRCGVDLDLVMAPGETPDHMVVWYQDKGVLFCGDNYYRSFPNLYAIRGTVYRDFDAWADTLDLLMGFDADVLAPGHTKALIGADRITEVLRDYRDAIRHVVDETRQGMDAGLTIDELAHSVKLPDDLAEKPYLREFYGRVDWSVRAYFVGTMGWFDGNPTSLGTLAPRDEGRRFIELIGGPDAVLEATENARSTGDYQWALQLIDRLIFSDRENSRAVKIKAEILKEFADEQINCTARHYYLQCSKELDQAKPVT
ncbi:MAG: alkyl/aryl-sulfatase [Rhodobacteraceae bacterium]|nr:alkyl/aryl-sulfatase [Paracoccaceae bacterium]